MILLFFSQLDLILLYYTKDVGYNFLIEPSGLEVYMNNDSSLQMPRTYLVLLYCIIVYLYWYNIQYHNCMIMVP